MDFSDRPDRSRKEDSTRVMMLGAEVYALLAALCFAGSQVTARRGLEHSSIISGVLVSLSTALVVLGVAVVLDPPKSVNATGTILFVVAGLAAPGVSRWAATTGVHRLGPSVAVPITQGARPLLAVLGALLLLGESMTLQKVVGLIAIVAGGTQLSRAREDARALALGSIEGPVEPLNRAKRIFRLRPGIMFPLLAGLAYATSDLVVKEALAHLPYPRFGAMIGMGSALAVWVVATAVAPPLRKQLRLGKDVGWLVISGVLAGLALINLFTALDVGDVTIVSPITASQPLAVFVFSRILLRRLERLTPSIVVAGCSIVAGTIIISL